MTVPPPSALGQRPRPPRVGLEPPRCDSGRGDALSKVCGGGAGGGFQVENHRGRKQPRMPQGEGTQRAGRAAESLGAEAGVGPRCAGRVRKHRLPGVGSWRELRVAGGSAQAGLGWGARPENRGLPPPNEELRHHGSRQALSEGATDPSGRRERTCDPKFS